MKIIDKGMGSAVISIAIYLILFSLLPGCGEFNDNPRETEMKLTVDISELKKQFGYSSDSDNGDSLGKEFRGISGPGDSEATSAVESLVIGAIVITARDTPYTTDEVLTDKDMEDIEDDVLNSAAYIDFVNLRTTEDDTVEFSVPPPGAGNWQVAAIGVDFKMEALIDLDRDEHDDAVMYYGFTPRFYDYYDIKEDTIIELEMKRNCLANEIVHPNGCATYSNILNDKPIVTPAVEIVGVEIFTNDKTYEIDPSKLPIIVRTESNKDDAVTELINFKNKVKDELEANDLFIHKGDTFTVITTHSLSPLQEEGGECEALPYEPSATVDDLIEYCGVQTYKVPITKLD